MIRRASHPIYGALLGLTLVAVPVTAADEITDALDASIAAQRAARESQQRINKLDDEARALREKQKAAQWQALQQSAYAEQLEQEAAAEEKKRGALEAELNRVAATGADLLPLMRRMVEELDAFVASDLPFLAEPRRARVAELKAYIEDEKRRSADKFRRVLDAYRTEVDYAHSLGIEELELDCGSGRGSASLVRIGRLALYCLFDGGQRGAQWDRAQAGWQPLDDESLKSLQRAAVLARGDAQPELLVLPVPVAERP